MSNFQKNSEIELPFWLKMFSNKPDAFDSGELTSEDDLNFSQDSLNRIGRLLGTGKTVILMGKDKPFKIFKDENNEIQIEQLEQFRYR